MQARNTPGGFPPDHIPASVGPGIMWSATLKEPTEFEGTPRYTNFSVKGQWCLLQLFRGKRKITDDIGNIWKWRYNSPGTYIPDPQRPGEFVDPEDFTKVFVLDQAFPYGRLADLTQNFIWDADPDTLPTPTTHSNEDSPSMSIYNKYADQFTHIHSKLRKAEMFDRFELFLMYKAPVDLYYSTPSQWVPIKKLKWHTAGTATKIDIDSARWHLIGTGVVSDGIADWVLHPTWLDIITIGSDLDVYDVAP